MIELEAGARLPARDAGRDRRARRPRAGYSAATLAPAIFHLRHLLQAGVPPAQALMDVAALEPSRPKRRLWQETAARVEAGSTLSAALAMHPRDVDETSLALIRAGEASGRLVALLEELETHLRWRHELAARLRTVSAYPLFAVLILLLTVGFLLGHVVPSLAAFLQAGERALPWHTTLLLSIGAFVSLQAPTLAVMLAVLVGLGAIVLPIAVALDERVRERRDASLLRMATLGRLIGALCTARWSRTVALLYANGVELGEALAVAEGTLGNRALRRELSGARAAMLAGERLGAALSACPSLPPTFVRLVRAGESSGALEPALRHGAAQLQLATRHTIARFEALIGPVLLGIGGALLLWIVLSVVSPLYERLGATGFA